VTLAYVGLGSNLDHPARRIEQAIEELDRLPHSRVVRRSSLYRSAPVGFADQPDFVNAVVQLETGLSADRLLAELQDVEARHGRARSFANAPRTLDLDLLTFNGLEMQSERLTLPHPRMQERAFVLKPLVEVAPEATIPGRGRAADLLARLGVQDVEKLP
jgi:2-amino-4-hydroxy-6-hydroxymethyldihydropteridine diphosphokinase